LRRVERKRREKKGEARERCLNENKTKLLLLLLLLFVVVVTLEILFHLNSQFFFALNLIF
jgi:hypothetical protein